MLCRAQLGFGRMVQDHFVLGVPIKLLSLSIGSGRHDDCHRMGISVQNSGVRFFAAAETFQPVGHVGKIFVTNLDELVRIRTGETGEIAI